MQLLLRFWKKSFWAVLPVAVALIAGGIALFFALGCGQVFSTVFPKTLSELTPETLPGAWVEDDIPLLYTAYARQADYRGGELSKVTGVHYVIGFGEEYYIGLFVRGQAVERAETVFSAGGVTGGLHVCGMIRAMDGETLSLYRAAAGGDSAVEQVMLPYYLDTDRVNGRSPTLLWAMVLLCVAMAAAGVAIAVWAVRWGGQKKLLAKAAQLGELPKMVEKLERFSQENQPIGGVWLDRHFVLFQAGAFSVLCRPWELAWVYRKPAHLPGEKRCFVTLHTLEGGRYRLLMEEYEGKKLMNRLSEIVPELEQGWSRGLAKAYREDRSSFAVKH